MAIDGRVLRPVADRRRGLRAGKHERHRRAGPRARPRPRSTPGSRSRRPRPMGRRPIRSHRSRGLCRAARCRPSTSATPTSTPITPDADDPAGDATFGGRLAARRWRGRAGRPASRPASSRPPRRSGRATPPRPAPPRPAWSRTTGRRSGSTGWRSRRPDSGRGPPRPPRHGHAGTGTGAGSASPYGAPHEAPGSGAGSAGGAGDTGGSPAPAIPAVGCPSHSRKAPQEPQNWSPGMLLKPQRLQIVRSVVGHQSVLASDQEHLELARQNRLTGQTRILANRHPGLDDQVIQRELVDDAAGVPDPDLAGGLLARLDRQGRRDQRDGCSHGRECSRASGPETGAGVRIGIVRSAYPGDGSGGFAARIRRWRDGRSGTRAAR